MSSGPMMAPVLTARATEDLHASFGEDVRLVEFAPNLDGRGRLTEFDFSAVPFPVHRMFAVSDVPAGTTRGGHRHEGVEQLLACVTGAITVELRRGEARHEIALSPESGALYVGAGVWASQRYLEEGSVLVVLASAPFDPTTYDSAH